MQFVAFQKPAARRFAFVAGSEYGASPRIAENSCRAVGDALESRGFAVESCLGGDQLRFSETFSRFLRNLSPNCEVILFLAGHSVDSDGDCFFIPEDGDARADLCMYGLLRKFFRVSLPTWVF